MRPTSRVKGEWTYLYRAVDKAGKTVDFYLSRKRDITRQVSLEIPVTSALSNDLFGKIIVFALLGAVGLVIARNAYGRRAWVTRHTVTFVAFFAAILVILFILHWIGVRGGWIQVIAIGLAAPVYFYGPWQWKPLTLKDKEYKNREQAIKRWESKTGKPYNSKTHEVDQLRKAAGSYK